MDSLARILLAEMSAQAGGVGCAPLKCKSLQRDETLARRDRETPFIEPDDAWKDELLDGSSCAGQFFFFFSQPASFVSSNRGKSTLIPENCQRGRCCNISKIKGF